MLFNEVQDNILNHLDEGYVAHGITADFSLGAGLAKILNNRYGLSDALSAAYDSVPVELRLGQAYLVSGTKVFNLVDKADRYDHVDYLTLETCLFVLKRECEARGIEKLIMPRIACGRDKLDWCVVSQMIQEVFEDTDIEITVYYK